MCRFRLGFFAGTAGVVAGSIGAGEASTSESPVPSADGCEARPSAGVHTAAVSTATRSVLECKPLGSVGYPVLSSGVAAVARLAPRQKLTASVNSSCESVGVLHTTSHPFPTYHATHLSSKVIAGRLCIMATFKGRKGKKTILAQ